MGWLCGCCGEMLLPKEELSSGWWEESQLFFTLVKGDNKSAVFACRWKQARGMRQLSARSEMGGIGFGGESAATPPRLLTSSTSTTQFSAAPVGIGIPCVK